MRFSLPSSSPITFATPLGATAWAVLIGVPVGIIALYFLKLRRRPVEVPSTLLWRRSLEDLHVNSLFQRLRKNLLLFLQLLAVLLAMLALLAPRIRGTDVPGQRYVLVIDESASMAATDVAPSRLGRAKEEAKKVVAAMNSDDLAMVIAFSDKARVVSNYTSNRDILKDRIERIAPTQQSTSLREALQVAAGLANPSSDLAARNLPQGVVAVNATIPPKLFVYTDGGFPDVDNFSLGNVEPEVVVIGPTPPAPAEATKADDKAKGKTPSDNVAILSLQASRGDEKPDQFQVFGRAHNYRAEAVSTEAKLLRHDPAKPRGSGMLVDAVALTIDPGSDQSFKFDLPEAGASELEVRLDVKDALPLDNRAFVVFGNPRKARVLVVTPGNRYLVDTLQTPTAEQLADVTVVSPEQAKTSPLDREIASGRFDLVIFDRVQPTTPPEANALYFGALPPGKAYEQAKVVEYPTILDWDLSHPLLQYIRDLAHIVIKKATVVDPPAGSTVLIEGPNKVALAFLAPRAGYVDAVVTFALLDGKSFNTDWVLRFSFPLFLFHSLRNLGNARDAAGTDVHQPGQPVVLRADAQVDEIKVTDPGGNSQNLKRTTQGTFIDNKADVTGIYRASWGKDGASTYAVNLFDARESDLAPRGIAPTGVSEAEAEKHKIKIGFNAVKGTRKSTPAVKDWWKPLAVLALGIVLLEWYIYNKRVYV